MDRIQDYEILEKIGETRGSLIYRGRKTGAKNTVILKSLKARSPSASETAIFRQECEIIKSINIDGIIKIFDIISREEEFILVLEDFNGIPISDILADDKIFDIRFFLNVAVKISGALGELHKRNVIHRNIKPDNILIGQNEGIVKITNFGISAVITHENEEIINPGILHGSLLYMSPEQTGRINRTVDYRTDFYSLGITFYKLLTGKVPFESDDPLEVIHSHIAREPVPPIELRPDIPHIISDIVMKLMAKNGDDRYQNASVLTADLGECIERLDPEGRIEAFELAKHDISGRFIMSQKLFGREKETGILISAFERICGAVPHEGGPGRVELMLVTGGPGIGKSALINEIGKPVAEKRGYFLSGKYEQFRRDTPYSAIIQGFQKLLKQILTESDEKIKDVRKNILESLGPNCRIITDMIPELELITGKQPEAARLAPNEARNRFNIVFERFVSAFNDRGHPIVLFLDDLHWADLASLQLIRNLITSINIGYMLIICSYRDNEINDMHPLRKILKDIEDSGTRINKITLSELAVNDVKNIIISLLKCGEERGLSLSELIFKKTGGNPFFINEFLRTLYNEKILEIDSYFGWKWDVERINQMSVTDNVVEFLSDKINKLPGRVQEVLKLCACIGNRFDPETLSLLIGNSMDDTLLILSKAIDEGFIGYSGGKYMFSHDRIYEAAYSLLPEEEKPLIHYMIGKFTLEKNPGDLRKTIFYIVDQLNLGLSHLTDAKEREELARLNLESGIKAKTSAAFLPALKYFETGMSLLQDECWNNQYYLALSLYTEAAEATYLKGDYYTMNQYISAVIGAARDIHDKLPIYETTIHSYDAQLNFKGSLGIAFDAFSSLNFSMPEKPGRLLTYITFLRIRPFLSIKNIDSLIDLPEMTDPGMLAVSLMLTYASKCAYFLSPDLFAFIPIKQVELSIKYGQCSAQVIAYIEMAVILTCAIGDIEAGYKLGNLALKMVKKLNARSYEARAFSLYNSTIAHWKDHLMSIRPEFMKCYYTGMETGDLEWSADSLFMYDNLGMLLGSRLAELESQMAKNHKIIEELKQSHFLSFHSIIWQTVLNLLGKSSCPSELKGIAVDDEQMIPVWKSSNAKTILGVFYINRLMLRYIFLDYQGALADSFTSAEYLDSIIGFPATRDFAFYSALARLALYPNASAQEKHEYGKYVRQHLKKFRKWAKHAPMNNVHRIQIIEAEKAGISGRNQEAEALYDKAIESSRKNEYPIEEAIANELAGIHYIVLNKFKTAKVYLQDAYNCYSRWGALAKLEQMRRKYPDLLSLSGTAFARAPEDPEGTGKGTASEIVDLATVIKVSQAISGEVVLAKLLTKMMRIAVGNAGAQKSFMILENQGKLLIEAEYNYKDDNIKVLESIPVDIHGGLSSSIINYVARTNGMLILNDAASEGDFTGDPYIVKNNPKSILCSPIINQGRLIGILYLENNLTTGAFTKERLEILNILSSQMAISIENARFYENLEQKVRERTKEIEASEQRFKDIVRSSADWIWESDSSGVFTYCSEQVEDIMGYKPEEIIGKRAYDFMPKDTLENTISAIGKLINQNKPFKEMDNWHIAKNGKRVCTIVCGVPVFNDKGESTGYRGLDRDITERREAEAKLKEIMEELSRSNKELEQFAYTVSHDLQEPLRKITTFGNRLKEKDEDDKRRADYIERMQGAAARMQELIQGLLSYSRVTTKSRPFGKVDLNRVVKEVISDLEIKIRDTAGKVEAGELPFVRADSLQMRQLFQNIIGNALKFHKAGEPPLVRVYALNDRIENNCSIAVEDNGIGIEEKNYLRIFEVFQRLHGRSEYEGSGIGLAVCKKIVERHNGTIKVESKIGEGTKFIINFPGTKVL